MATIREVARLAGVSPATASRVLNGDSRVNPVLAARVQAVIAELQYYPRRAARTLRGKQARILGLLIGDIQNPFFTSLVRGVEDVAQSSGYSVILCNSDEDPTKEAQYIQVLCEEQVAGVIVAPTRARQTALRQLHAQHIPVVTVDRRIKDREADAVLVDNVRGAHLATAHLLANGYRRIGAIVGPLTLSTATERLEGYRQALEEAGIHPDPALERTGSLKEESGRLLARDLLDADPQLDAIFSANNLTTLGVLDALHGGGLKVPDDIGLVGFDEMPWAMLSEISLTTVAQPVYDIGSTAAMRLLQRLRSPEAFTRQEIILAPTLLVRGSSRERTPARGNDRSQPVRMTRFGQETTLPSSPAGT